MAELAPSIFWKFDSLKGSRNYQQWATSIKALSIRTRTWGLLSGTEKRPSYVEPHGTNHVTEDKAKAEASSSENAESSVKGYVDLSAEQKKWDQKNDDARAMLNAKIHPSTWKTFKNMSSAPDIWKLAKERFSQQGDWATVDSVFAALCHSDASKFKTIQGYYDHISKHNQRLVGMGKIVPGWLLAAIFRQGLTVDQAPYVFYLMEGAEKSKTELTLDEMAQALIRQERRVQAAKEIRKH